MFQEEINFVKLYQINYTFASFTFTVEAVLDVKSEYFEHNKPFVIQPLHILIYSTVFHANLHTRCATSWCDLDLTFDLVIVTASFKILSGLFLGFHKVYKVDTWYRHWVGGVGVHHCVTFNFGFSEVRFTCHI